MKVKLLRSYGSRWGPGKLHSAINQGTGRSPYWVAWCTGEPIYAELVEGAPDDVTCKRCLRKGPGAG